MSAATEFGGVQVLPESVKPVSAQSIDVDPCLPIDCVRPVCADRHCAAPRPYGVQYKLRLFSDTG